MQHPGVADSRGGGGRKSTKKILNFDRIWQKNIKVGNQYRNSKMHSKRCGLTYREGKTTFKEAGQEQSKINTTK